MSLPPTPVYSILSSSVNDVIALDMMPHEAMCSRCNYNGADVRFVVCGCCIHSVSVLKFISIIFFNRDMFLLMLKVSVTPEVFESL